MNAQGLDWVAPALEPGEEVDLFGGAFEIERLPEPRPDQLTAAFVMTRSVREDGDLRRGDLERLPHHRLARERRRDQL